MAQTSGKTPASDKKAPAAEGEAPAVAAKGKAFFDRAGQAAQVQAEDAPLLGNGEKSQPIETSLPKMNIDIPHDEITRFCRKWKVKELSLFGEAIRQDFKPEGDIDVLVEFDAESSWRTVDFVDMMKELNVMFGREADLVVKDSHGNPFRRYNLKGGTRGSQMTETSGKTPASGKKAPAADGKAPAGDGKKPVAEGKAPAGDGKATAAEGKAAPAVVKGKGKAFFDRADQVLATGNWDFAIELYINGLQREPDNIERGHQPLREASLNRTHAGGKPAGFMEKRKWPPGKDPITQLVSAEFLLAKEPGNEQYMEGVMRAAIALEQRPLIRWMGQIALESQRQAARKNRKLLQFLIDALHNIEQYRLAIDACEIAREAEPDNSAIQNILGELMAKETIQRGKYDQEGSFTKGVKDLEGQKKLIEKDKLAQSDEFRLQQIEEAKADYLKTPNIPGKVGAYVDTLLLMQDESYENEAVDVLAKAFREHNAYQYKLRIGEIRIKQMTRRFRKLRDAGDKAAATVALKDLAEFELVEYGERAMNYPTDMSIKFELGRRQLALGRLDEAIGSLQQARRDARHSVQASSLLGQAFEKKGWFREASETLERVLEAELTEDRAKDIRYHLGNVYEKMDELVKAQDQYSEVAQMDYNYKDARQRLEEVRKKIDQREKEKGGV